MTAQGNLKLLDRWNDELFINKHGKRRTGVGNYKR